MTKLYLPKTTDVQWSEEQQAVFEWFTYGSDHLLVRARAGTGKTTTLIEGVKRAPERSKCVAAFNAAIKDELVARLQGTHVHAKTLHALGFACIRQHWRKLKKEPVSKTRAGDLAAAAAKEILKRESMTKEKVPWRTLRIIEAMHTAIRGILGDPLIRWTDEGEGKLRVFDWLLAWNSAWEEIPDGDFWNVERCAEAAWEAVQLAKIESTEVDFADMLFLPLAMDWVRPKYDLMVVDEAQDMSQLQLELALQLCRGRFALVGDDRQAIYGFRGADVGCLDRLKEELNASELTLTTTYRCPLSVVEIAREFVPDLRPKPEAEVGSAPERVSEETLLQQIEPGDFLLSRTNAPLATWYLRLLRTGIPVYIKGLDMGVRAKNLAVMLAEQLPQMSLDLLTQALERWEEKQLARIRARAKGPIDELVAAKLEKLMDDCEVLRAYIKGSRDYQNLIGRLTTCGVKDDQPVTGAVMCSSVHKAKGLEANRVWLVGTSFRGDINDPSEESNICYVAVTRSKSELYLLGSTWKTFFYGRQAADARQQKRQQQYNSGVWDEDELDEG